MTINIERWYLRNDGNYYNEASERKSPVELDVYKCIKLKEDPSFQLIKVLFSVDPATIRTTL